MANRAYYALLSILKSKIVTREIKLNIYKILIRPVATYGSESWTLNKDTCSQIAIFERKIMRKIFGGVQVGNTCRIRYNKELYDMFKEPNIESFIRISRLRWLGHVGRMENHRKVKMVTIQKIEGTRLRGRPRLRWMDCVECDLVRFGIRNWMKQAEDLEGWKRIINEVKALLGCSTH